jgi:carbon-monoxide dehydrogenase iron sulfur subunit
MIVKQKQVYCRPALCTACRICANACAVVHEGVANPRLGRITIRRNAFERYEFQELCRHCEDAPCEDACMVGCIEKDDETGIVTNDDRCVGCWMCVMVCPYGGIKRDVVKQMAIKCDQCKDIGDPVCVKVCPTGALVYEEREDAPEEPFFTGPTVA